MQQQNAATAPASSDSKRPAKTSGLHQRPLSTFRRLVHTEEINGLVHLDQGAAAAQRCWPGVYAGLHPQARRSRRLARHAADTARFSSHPFQLVAAVPKGARSHHYAIGYADHDPAAARKDLIGAFEGYQRCFRLLPSLFWFIDVARLLVES